MDQVVFVVFTALPFAVCVNWTLALLIDAFSGGRDRFVLALFGVFASTLYFMHFLHFNNIGGPVPECIWTFCSLSVYPLFGIYLVTLTDHRPVPAVVWVSSLTPAALVTATQAAAFARGADVGAVAFVTKLLFPVLVIFTLVQGWRHLRAFRAEISNFYSDTTGKELRKVDILLVLFLLTSLASVVFSSIGRDRFEDSLAVALPSILFSLLLFGIFYVGRLSRFDASSFALDLQESGIPQEPPETGDFLLVRIIEAMESGKLYLQPGFKIIDLANAVGSNRTYVSNCINRKLEMSFSDFVGRYRAREAMDILRREGNTVGMDALASRSGFSGRSQLYRSFKKETGFSPSEWLSGR